MIMDRIAARVPQDGHDIPEKTIMRRSHKGLHNFREVYSQLADSWSLYDKAQSPPRLLEKGGSHAR
jgi:predicted ABC-type ATPase